ncbi:sialidase family protein [Propylenella binzhouense]|uniref:Sialidase domain-containing protein n=1 Tax=Propylenella binzhouense TaxID=2555902 RepID=A0A964WUQ7_9HYPH|nr:sialidase family protein [Propylenella binzhouense]MYZ49279.1 hypothetical protein [Propylenella binzhouense]
MQAEIPKAAAPRRLSSVLAGAAALVFVALAAAGLAVPAAEYRFVPGTVADPAGAEPVFRTDVVARGEAGLLHAPSIAPTGDGGLLAVWFQGSEEGAPDVEIRSARFAGGRWEAPRKVTSGEATGRELGRYVNTVGNAVLVPRPDGELWLVYVSVSLGGWATSQLNLKRSHDNGASWSAAERLVTSPFFNLSTLVKTRPVQFAGGLAGVPAYHEMAAKFPELLVLGPDGALVDKRRLGSGGRIAIQPAIAALDAERAVALMRRGRSSAPHLFASHTEDGGATWSAVRPTGLPNPGGPAGLLRLDPDTLLLVFGDSARRETNLTLAVSKDGGVSWRRIARIAEMPEDAPGEITYPFMTADPSGAIHVVWADKRDLTIRHAMFNRAWLDRQAELP